LISKTMPTSQFNSALARLLTIGASPVKIERYVA
jgi:hypothetical protein